LLELADGQRGSFAVVDLTQVTFIDSTGLSALVTAEKHFRRLGRKLRLVVSHPAVLRVFEVTNLDEIFDIFPTLTEAIPARLLSDIALTSD
jgi:anti-sigma B factor antagonist